MKILLAIYLLAPYFEAHASQCLDWKVYETAGNEVFYSARENSEKPETRKKVKGADAGSFSQLRHPPIRAKDSRKGLKCKVPYGTDRLHVYYEDRVVKGVDPKNFEILDWGAYARAGDKIFFEGKPVEGVDAATFEAIEGEGGRDKFVLVENGKLQASPASKVNWEKAQQNLEKSLKPGNGGIPPGECPVSKVKLPADAGILLLDFAEGRDSGHAIDASGKNAGVLDVTVNSRKPVVLVLSGGPKPVIWNIRWSEKTKIVAVLKDSRTVVAGLPADASIYPANKLRAPCALPPFAAPYLVKKELESRILHHDRQTVTSIFGKPIDKVYALPSAELMVVGDVPVAGTKFLTSNETPVESFFFTR